MSTKKDYSKWYWSYIPHYRDVEDDPEEKSIKSDVEEETIEVDSFAINPIDFEFRDEADRKWWRVFDEYEYRFNKKSRSNKSWWRWYDKDASTAEKKLVVKLDLMMVTFGIISFWSKNLNSSNVTNAYVSGMREDLNLTGNDLSNAIALYNAGMVIFQVFYMYLFPRVPMHLMFFLGDLGWSTVSLFTCFIQNVEQLKACRFLEGATSAGYFMMIHYLFGCWYKPDELGRRGGLYYCGMMLGTLTSGLLQAQLFESLHNVSGFAGWRWMFMIDGLITLPIALFALYMVPGTPQACYSLFLTDDEIRLSRKRLRDANITVPTKDPPPFFNWGLWKKIFKSWQFYVLPLLDALFWNCSSSHTGFALWLKALNRYSVPQLNRITTIPPALTIAFIIVVCFSADILRSRFTPMVTAIAINFSTCIILAVWHVPESAKWYAFFAGYFGTTISSLVYGWLNDIMRHDPQARAIVLCASNIFANQSTAWLAALTFPTSEAPTFKKGYIFTSTVNGVLISWIFVTLFFYKRQEKRDARKNGIVLYNTRTGNIPDDVAKWLDADGKVNYERKSSLTGSFNEKSLLTGVVTENRSLSD